jgi:DNA-binding beta-propeller fold protein YncE
LIQVKTVKKLKTGHTVKALLTSPNGKRLYVVNQFNDSVSEFDVESGKELRKFQAVREPIAADISPDGKLLLIANHLPVGRADTGITAAVITIIDLDSGNLIKSLQLPNGSTDLNDIKISPDGRYACVTHILSRFHLPTNTIRPWLDEHKCKDYY